MERWGTAEESGCDGGGGGDIVTEERGGERWREKDRSRWLMNRFFVT